MDTHDHENVTKPLSFEQLRDLARKHFNKEFRIVEYKDIINANSLDDFIKPHEAIIIYYPTESMTFGHYVALVRNGDTVFFHDSYGNRPDSERIKVNPSLYRGEGETNSLIEKLLKSGLNVDYNNHKHQQFKNNSCTCGRHSLMRCGFGNLSTEQYDKMLKYCCDTNNFKDLDNMVAMIIS